MSNTFDFSAMTNSLTQITNSNGQQQPISNYIDDPMDIDVADAPGEDGQEIADQQVVSINNYDPMDISDDEDTRSIIADAPEDEQEYADLLAFFKTKRNVIDILYDYIFKNNAFVARWKGRLSREKSADNGKPAKKRRGNYGDVEYACYEAWVKASKVNDRLAMMNAVKHAMKNEAEENSNEDTKRKRNFDDDDLHYGNVRKARYN